MIDEKAIEQRGYNRGIEHAAMVAYEKINEHRYNDSLDPDLRCIREVVAAAIRDLIKAAT